MLRPEPARGLGRWSGMTMICPKCHDVMRQYERNGVTVDQCQECRGIFLDRGELEYLVAAEASFAAGGPPAAPVPQPAPQPAPPAPASSGSPLATLLPGGLTGGTGSTGAGGKGDLLRDGAQLLKTAAREYARHSGTSGKKKGKKSFVEGLFG